MLVKKGNIFLPYDIVTVTLPILIVASAPDTPVSCGNNILTLLPSLYKLKGGKPTGASVKFVKTKPSICKGFCESNCVKYTLKVLISCSKYTVLYSFGGKGKGGRRNEPHSHLSSPIWFTV